MTAIHSSTAPKWPSVPNTGPPHQSEPHRPSSDLFRQLKLSRGSSLGERIQAPLVHCNVLCFLVLLLEPDFLFRNDLQEEAQGHGRQTGGELSAVARGNAACRVPRWWTCPGQGKGFVTPTENERSQGRSLLHGQDMGKTPNHRKSIEQWLVVDGGWRLAVGGGWRLAVGGGWRRLAVGGWGFMILGGCS